MFKVRSLNLRLSLERRLQTCKLGRDDVHVPKSDYRPRRRKVFGHGEYVYILVHFVSLWLVCARVVSYLVGC